MPLGRHPRLCPIPRKLLLELGNRRAGNAGMNVDQTRLRIYIVEIVVLPVATKAAR
jgi:ABC-type enterobactin transport system permease subunit